MEEFELQLLLGRIRQLSDEHWHLLEQPRRVMGDNAWVGPSARVFDHELEGNSRALHAQLEKAIDLVHAKLPTRIL